MSVVSLECGSEQRERLVVSFLNFRLYFTNEAVEAFVQAYVNNWWQGWDRDPGPLTATPSGHLTCIRRRT